MNDQNSSLESRINDVRRDVDELLASTTRRTSRMRVILIIICLAMIGYMTFIYTQLSGVDANLVALLAEKEIQDHIEDGGKKLAAKLNDQAPAIFDKLQERAEAMPDQLAENVRAKINEKLNETIPQIEKDMTSQMLDLIDRLADQAYEVNKDDMSNADFQKLMDDVAEAVNRDSMALLDKFHARVKEVSAPIIAHIDKLAEGKNLIEREKHQRDILLAAMAIIEKKAVDSKAAEDSKPQMRKPAS